MAAIKEQEVIDLTSFQLFSHMASEEVVLLIFSFFGDAKVIPKPRFTYRSLFQHQRLNIQSILDTSLLHFLTGTD